MRDTGYAPGWPAMEARDQRRREMWEYAAVISTLTGYAYETGVDRVVFMPRVDKIVVHCYDYVTQDFPS